MNQQIEVTDRFSGRAQAYERFRERYDPAVVLPRLREWCGLTSQCTIADVGAGTGMLADVFLANGNRVIAIEPNADMRETCIALHRSTPRLDVRDGTAEHTGLAAASVDMVSVGRALHWFHVERSMAEFQRILKPGGWVAVVAFGRMDAEHATNEAYERLMRNASSQESTRAGYRAYEEFANYFRSGEFHHEEIDGAMHLDWETLRGLTLSISHAPRESDSSFPAFEEHLRAFFQTFERDGKVELATRYWINVGRLNPR